MNTGHFFWDWVRSLPLQRREYLMSLYVQVIREHKARWR